jgi:hypothetical protein
MADERSGLVARLGVIATGRGDLARPRRRSRFEDAAPPALVEVHDEHDADRPAGRAVDDAATTSTPAPPVRPISVPSRADGPRARELSDADTSVTGQEPTGAQPESVRREIEVAHTAAPADAPAATTPVAVAHEASTAAAAPTTTVVVNDEHHHHVEHVDRHEHRHGGAVTELFQWIEEGAPPAPVPSGAPAAPATPRGDRIGPASEPPATRRDDVRRGEATLRPATVVRIGRVEVRTVDPEPPARSRPIVAAPLEFAGPTLEEFLGGRP